MKSIVAGCLGVVMVGLSGVVLADDGYCREYQRNVTIGGRVQNMYGTACLQPDGSWRTAEPERVEYADEPYQVASAAPVMVQQPVVYEPYYEPVYSSYRYYPGPSFGLSLGWSDRDHGGWRGGHGGHGGHHGHGRH